MSWKARLCNRLAFVRILAHPEAASSANARAYWDKNYSLIQMMNPRFAFMMRDIQAEGVEPYMLVRYFGDSTKEHKLVPGTPFEDHNPADVEISLAGKSLEEIDAALRDAALYGESLPPGCAADSYTLDFIQE